MTSFQENYLKNSEMIDSILERGYRLRSAIISSILNNEPQNVNIDKCVKSDIYQKINSFLNGDNMSRDDELSAREALKTLSPEEISQIWGKTESCKCPLCTEFDRKQSEDEDIEKYLKFVDSMKIHIHGVSLTHAGEKKVNLDKFGGTFFLEYQIGKDSVRMCARRGHSDIVAFKQTSMHTIAWEKMDKIIKFRLNFRHFKQKNAIQLGIAQFDLKSFRAGQNFTCIQELAIKLDESNPIVVGGLKISVVLGTGGLYFGKEFLNVISNNKENEELAGDNLMRVSQNFKNVTQRSDLQKSQKTKTVSQILEPVPNLSFPKMINVPQSSKTKDTYKSGVVSQNNSLRGYDSRLVPQKSDPISQRSNPRNDDSISVSQRSNLVSHESRLVSQRSDQAKDKTQNLDSAEYGSRFIAQKPNPVPHEYGLDSKNFASASHGSRLVAQNSNPVPHEYGLGSNKHRLISHNPDSEMKLISQRSDSAGYESGLVSQRAVFEEAKQLLFGLVTVKTAEFQVKILKSYFSCQLFNSKEIVRSEVVFGSEPNYNFSQQFPVVYDEKFLFDVRENYLVFEFFENNFLLGITRVNLHQLYLSYRNPVIVKYLKLQKLPIIASDGWELIINPRNDETIGRVHLYVALGTREQIDNCPKLPETCEIGIQSNMEQFLEKLIETKKTNEENQVRSTTDLLETLQKALEVETTKDSFKAKISINSALHLPNRRKCRARNNRNGNANQRNRKYEIVLPTTYVTFEDFKGVQKETPIIQKTTAPKWDATFDEIELPLDFLTDTQKCLIFKVWRKPHNYNGTNIHTDHVIGFAAVDLTVLAAGLPCIQGWYNINDLAKKNNGQLHIEVTPLEPVTQFRREVSCATVPEVPEPEELLGRALKRKFTELDEITQRLRSRLSKVTYNDESDDDRVADEFERDISSVCEEDSDESGTAKMDEREKIDDLLEKMSLTTGSRCVSGCSSDAKLM